jgi:hypothetical protein
VPLYSHSPLLFVQGVAGMSWDAFRHSPFPLSSTAIWVNWYQVIYVVVRHVIEESRGSCLKLNTAGQSSLRCWLNSSFIMHKQAN